MEIGLELTNDDRVVLWRVMDRPMISVGSNPECDICVPDETIAPIHFVLRREGNNLFLTAYHHQGVDVNRERVETDTQLANGDIIALGPLTATIRFYEPEGAHRAARTLTLTQERAAPAVQMEITAPQALPGQRWRLDNVLRVGGEPSNDIVLDDPYVSGFHAELLHEGGRCFVRDLNSRNGVFVGGQQVKEGEVPIGSQLRIGKTILLLRAAGNADASPATNTRMVGSSPVMEELRQQIYRMASTDAPVLITGETGTGKEVAARLLAELSQRAGKPFHTLNCGALGKNLIESELFGHEKGAFTGAVARKIGAFEHCNGGTLFLDEIGELPLELQPKLLRVVEYGEVRRVGATEVFKVNVRLLAATNRNLEAEANKGTFRADLYHRLHVLRVNLPPLRARPRDIPELVRHFVSQFTPGASVEVTAAAMEKLKSYDWPGNVRELRHTVQRAVLMRQGDVLDVNDFETAPSSLPTRVEAASVVSSRTLAEIEREAIVHELMRHGGNKTEAAKALGISRSTIHRKIEDYKIVLEN